MSKLILPNTTEVIVPSRRGFLLGAGAGVLAGIIGAPMIAKAENLMQINSLQNRLVWAFVDKYLIDKMEDYKKRRVPAPDWLSSRYYAWVESGINASAAWDTDFMSDWQRHNDSLHYELRRQAEIHVHRSEREKRSIFNDFVNHSPTGNYGSRYGHLSIPEPKKAGIII